jgi:light-regulated signal transduction histidine kinase (bacteriophytochrome)
LDRIKQFATGRPLRELLGSHGPSDLRSSPFDHELELADGRRVWISLRKSVAAEDGESRLVDGIVADISDRKTHERLLQESNRALQRANEDLNQFAYAASHDLQEPLRMVGTYSGLIKRRSAGKLDSESDEFLGYVTDGVQRMDQLLSDLLTYVRVAQSSLEIAANMIDADQALDQALANLRAAIEEKGAVVKREPLPTITMQEAHLVQLFQNLIGNAIKYGAATRPEVRVASERVEGVWRFAVSDNGIGIPPEHHKKIFGVFKRLHGHDYPGTGIGLAICTKIVERYGGEIWVDSQVGKGSTFYFTAR